MLTGTLGGVVVADVGILGTDDGGGGAVAYGGCNAESREGKETGDELLYDCSSSDLNALRWDEMRLTGHERTEEVIPYERIGNMGWGEGGRGEAYDFCERIEGVWG